MLNIHPVSFTAQSHPEELKQIAKLIDEQKVKPMTVEGLPLEKATEAQKKSEEGHVAGKLVLQVV